MPKFEFEVEVEYSGSQKFIIEVCAESESQANDMAPSEAIYCFEIPDSIDDIDLCVVSKRLVNTLCDSDLPYRCTRTGDLLEYMHAQKNMPNGVREAPHKGE